MKKIYIILLGFLCLINVRAAEANASLSGLVKDVNGNPLVGVSLYVSDLKAGAVSDANGNYKFENLPKRALLIQVSYTGYKMLAQTIDLSKVASQDFVLEESIIEMNEVVVTGQASASQRIRTPSPISVISHKELLQQSSTNIIDALSSQPGVSQITTGGGISKPVIRGLGYNRVVVINDGVRQEGQQWGDEHGIEIDENEVTRIEILKGPASLMYGSDAMAGVINLFSAPILPQGKMQVNALANYQTNNGLMAYSVDFAGHKKAFVWDMRYSNKQAHSYQNKQDGYVYGSGFAEQAGSALLGVNKSWGYSHLSLSAYELSPGIVEGERDSVTGEFIKPLALAGGEVGEEIASSSDNTSYSHSMPYQLVQHYKAVWNNNILLGAGSLKATLAYQQNRRKEFEDVLNPAAYALYFQLHTLNYDVHYVLPEKNGYGFSFGVNGMYQQSLNKGEEFLVPEYNLFDAGVFMLAKKSWKKLDVSGGLRVDQRQQEAKSLYLNADDEITTAQDMNATERFAGFNTRFVGLSGSVGLSYQLSKYWNTKLNLSRGYRAPNISELGANGVHEGTIRYELGNASLKAESSLQVDFELGFTAEHVNAKLNLFSNHINNYIFAKKLMSIQGADSIMEEHACYKFDAGNAQTQGGEFFIDFHPHPWDWLHFENSFSYVQAILLNQPDSTKYLPFTPAAKWKSDIRVDFAKKNKYLNNSYLSFGLEHYFEQDKVYAANETETVTPAYTLINASLGTDFVWKKRRICSVYITGTNLADIAYQSHLSRLKYAAENNVTGKTGVYNMGRNISLKLLVPVDL